jgi:hypothetical protein
VAPSDTRSAPAPPARTATTPPADGDRPVASTDMGRYVRLAAAVVASTRRPGRTAQLQAATHSRDCIAPGGGTEAGQLALGPRRSQRPPNVRLDGHQAADAMTR